MASSQTEEPERADSETGRPEEQLSPHDQVEDGPESGAGEGVSVMEEDLPVVETPSTFNISSFSSQASHQSILFYDPDSQDPHVPVELPAVASAPLPVYNVYNIQLPPSPGVPIIKVQPFLNGQDFLNLKALCWPYVSRRLLALLIILGCLIALILILGIGLGVGQRNCSGKFRCVSSARCISRKAVCDGVNDCRDGEDELNCVRVSGRLQVLQVFSRGLWRTVCSEGWDSQMGSMACKQLGYNSYVNSSTVPISSIEKDFQKKLVALKNNQITLQQISKIHGSYIRKTRCSSSTVTVVKCIECGLRPAISNRIVGGTVSKYGQVPWQVSLYYQSQPLCGGSIISERWIVTAAHCVYGFVQPVLWAVYAGVIDQPLGGPGARAVEKIIYHNKYRPEKQDYNIALLKLQLPLSFSDVVSPICLPSHGVSFQAGQMCLISGWGATEDGGEASVSLNVAQVPLLSIRNCHGLEVTSWNICAGYMAGGAGTCQGDNGGPLACQGSGWTLVGTASWAQSCGERNKPGVYTSISEALTWIQQQMEIEEDSSR